MANLAQLVKQCVVKVDDDILEEFGDRHASVDTNGYISIGFSRKTPPRRRLLHRVIVPGHPVVHHINNDKTDNRRINLMGTTQSYNLLVKRLATDDTTRGTRLHKKTGRWQARIWKDNKERSLGYFDTQEEARAAYIAGYATLVADRLDKDNAKREELTESQKNAKEQYERNRTPEQIKASVRLEVQDGIHRATSETSA